MKLEHIIFAGDSAGGHLTTSVALLAILRGFRPPDGILAHYPVYDCSTSFKPSTLLAMDEWLLSEAFMSCVMSCFLRHGGNAETNPILSPLNAPDELLALLPQIVMTSCEADVLRDQPILFMDRLLKIDGGKDPNRAKLIFFRDYCHGFNSFDLKAKGVSEYRNGTRISIQTLREMFERMEIKAQLKELKERGEIITTEE